MPVPWICPGHYPLDDAIERHRRCPLGGGRGYAVCVSVAGGQQVELGQSNILLPVRELAPLWGVRPGTVSRWRRRAVADGYLRLVEGRKFQATEFRFDVSRFQVLQDTAKDGTEEGFEQAGGARRRYTAAGRGVGKDQGHQSQELSGAPGPGAFPGPVPLILGPNGSGKSTVRNALAAVASDGSLPIDSVLSAGASLVSGTPGRLPVELEIVWSDPSVVTRTVALYPEGKPCQPRGCSRRARTLTSSGRTRPRGTSAGTSPTARAGRGPSAPAGRARSGRSASGASSRTS